MNGPPERDSWRAWSEREAGAVRARGQWRAPADFDADGPEGKLVADGHAVVSFASNDYLGLTHHPAVLAAAHDAIDRWGTGAGAARLIVGSRPVHHELEAELADWKQTDAAVLFYRTTAESPVASLGLVDGSLARAAGRRGFDLTLPEVVPVFFSDRTTNQELRTKDNRSCAASPVS